MQSVGKAEGGIRDGFGHGCYPRRNPTAGGFEQSIHPSSISASVSSVFELVPNTISTAANSAKKAR